MGNQVNLYHPIDRWVSQKMNNFSSLLIIDLFQQFLEKVKDLNLPIRILQLKIRMERPQASWIIMIKYIKNLKKINLKILMKKNYGLSTES